MCRAWHDVAVFYFQLLAVIAVFAAIAWLATGRGGEIGETHPDRPDVALPNERQLQKGDIDAARFTVGWRGYRMDEVDLVLDRLAAEIDYRDRLIAELAPQTASVGSGASVGGGVEYEPVSRPGIVADHFAAPEDTVRVELGTMADVVPTGVTGVTGPQHAESWSTENADGADHAARADGTDGNPLSAWYRKPE